MLNNTKIKRLKPRDKTYRVVDSDGLYIEVKPNGRKFWRYRYKKHDGKSTMASLGEYPAVCIDLARSERDSRKGKSEFGNMMFADVAEQWVAFKNYQSEKNAKLEWRRVEMYLLPKLGRMRITGIRPVHVLPILKSIEVSGHLEVAKRVRSIASQIFRYGVVNLMCDHDPAGVLRGATKLPVVKHLPAIVDEPGFADLLKRIDAADRLMPTVKFCLQVAPYVMLRSGEIRNSTPDHLDFNKKMWVIPGRIMKLKKDLVIPLHDDVINILRQSLQFSDGDFIFPGTRNGRPISENTLNLALRSLGYAKGEVVFHGFRSSFSTLAREVLRFEDDLIERQLAHVDSNSVRAAYDRSYRIEERTIMLQRWGDYLAHLKKTE